MSEKTRPLCLKFIHVASLLFVWNPPAGTDNRQEKLWYLFKKKVNQSRYRSGVAQRVPGNFHDNGTGRW